MKVERVETETGSRIEPPLDQRWDDLTKLQWKAAVVGLDCGVTPVIEKCDTHVGVTGIWIPVRGRYMVLLPGRTSTTGNFYDTWSFLNGFEAGVSCR